MRIQGITLPDNKRLEFSLTAVYGIGRSRAKSILDQVKVDHTTKTKDLNTDQEGAIRALVEGFQIEGDLKRNVSGNIKRVKDIKSYKGTRHSKQLPVRGQRTKTNSRTVRGNARKTMGSGKRSVDKK